MSSGTRAKLRVRLATDTDLGAISAIAESAYGKYVSRLGRAPAPMVADYAALLEKGHLYVLDLGAGDPVGLAVFAVAGREVFIDNLAVRPEHQASGIASRFLEEVERKGREAGARLVKTRTNAAMHENIALYQSVGFAVSSRVVEDDNRSRVYLVKRIAAQDTFAEFFPEELRPAAELFLHKLLGKKELSLSWKAWGLTLQITGRHEARAQTVGWCIVPGYRDRRGRQDLTLGLDRKAALSGGERAFLLALERLPRVRRVDAQGTWIVGVTCSWQDALAGAGGEVIERSLSLAREHLL